MRLLSSQFFSFIFGAQVSTYSENRTDWGIWNSRWAPWLAGWLPREFNLLSHSVRLDDTQTWSSQDGEAVMYFQRLGRPLSKLSVED